MSVLVIYVSETAANEDADQTCDHSSSVEHLLRVANAVGEAIVLYAFAGEEGDAVYQAIRDCCISYQVSQLLYMKLNEESLAFEQIAKVVEEHCRNAQNIGTILVEDHAVGTNIAAYLGVAFDAGVVTHVQAINPQGTVSKMVLGGSSTVEVRIISTPKILTITDSYTFETEKPDASGFTGSRIECSGQQQRAGLEVINIAAPDTRKVVVSRQPEEKVNDHRPALRDAKIVVAGGRGVGEDWTILEELADAIGDNQGGAAIGATKAAVDSGWVRHELQIGQTGIVVSPDLYISAGISGAQQQKSGMQTSRTILAINNDPDALVFEIADFGIIGDVHQVIPALTAEIKRRTS